MTDVKTEDKIAIDGFTEEGENLSSINEGSEQLGMKKHSHGDAPVVPEASRGERRTSFKLEDFAPLTGREEDWRFTPLKRLRGLHTDELTGSGPSINVTAGSSVTVETVGADDSRRGRAFVPDDRVAAAAWEAVREVTVITIPDETSLDAEVTVAITGTDRAASAQHIIIDSGKFSRAVVVLDHQGTTTLAQNVEVIVGESSHLTVVSIQEWDDDAVHASAQQARVGRDAHYKHVAVNLGGDLVRLTPSSRFDAPGGNVEMYGLYFADAGQHFEQRLLVDHAVPKCKSRVTYKGALQGRGAHTVWVGDVLIRKEAEGTDSYETNRNLVLTDGARADSVPNLEIETGLIEGAGHASATGRFDDEQLFYFMARGIPEDVARRLVVRGFLNEIIQQIGVPAIEERLSEAVERELSAGNL
ncbi:Fe-S cluster assembly protein SufD [Arthrobacter roseus]|uniref:Fe-S cluster assembly protein SufD n=1 Tax=Arthrobacter roseus TaxID=136274 RepID=UPI003B83A0F6|nr:Fe-S cluster assembly protein SufD [Arthrobacter roseus]